MFGKMNDESSGRGRDRRGAGSRVSVAFGAFFSEVGAVRVRAVCRVTEPLVARYPYQKPRIVCQFETTSVCFGRVRVVQSRSALCGDFAIRVCARRCGAQHGRVRHVF